MYATVRAHPRRATLALAFALMGLYGTLVGTGVASADFVCPVLPVSEQAQTNSQAGFIVISGGDTSILPGQAGSMESSPVSVPDQATNDGGNGTPGGAHATPGDSNYTAIWNTDA